MEIYFHLHHDKNLLKVRISIYLQQKTKAHLFFLLPLFKIHTLNSSSSLVTKELVCERNSNEHLIRQLFLPLCTLLSLHTHTHDLVHAAHDLVHAALGKQVWLDWSGISESLPGSGALLSSLTDASAGVFAKYSDQRNNCEVEI